VIHAPPNHKLSGLPALDEGMVTRSSCRHVSRRERAWYAMAPGRGTACLSASVTWLAARATSLPI